MFVITIEEIKKYVKKEIEKDLFSDEAVAVIIDNKVLSKSEIISYLDFFIRQRSGMSNMELAISK